MTPNWSVLLILLSPPKVFRPFHYLLEYRTRAELVHPHSQSLCGETSTASFAKFSLIGRYLSKSLGTAHVPVQEFSLQVFCRHLYQYICYCQYFSLVPLDPRELCERGCTVAKVLAATRYLYQDNFYSSDYAQSPVPVPWNLVKSTVKSPQEGLVLSWHGIAWAIPSCWISLAWQTKPIVGWCRDL